MEKDKQDVIEVEVEETTVEEAVEKQLEELPRCEIRVGMRQDGQLYFTISGLEQNLIIVDGLLDYAKREMDKVWSVKLTTQE